MLSPAYCMNRCRQRGSFWLITGRVHCAPPVDVPVPVAVPEGDALPDADPLDAVDADDDSGLIGVDPWNPTSVTADVEVQQSDGCAGGRKSSRGYCSCSTVFPPRPS